MDFLLQDIALYISVVTTALCLLEVFLLTNISRFVRQQASSSRQRTFAFVDTCEESIDHFLFFSIFYKYGMVHSVRRQESSDESDEAGPYTPMFR
ncbi:hypothetical protein U3450_001253 [Bacillus cytotoxicus]|uniref:hypothetical protein n=1 Tax=unclassified Bacillus cereus group TaxID=2750818 RepID=UPI001F5A5B7D|nr:MULTISPECIES: hypothetical protein [unclassified Bacillus cereus group]EMA6342370.1 hypothetical protein [Bacillus cytotoxicus]